jgi:hypothetical protein
MHRSIQLLIAITAILAASTSHAQNSVVGSATRSDSIDLLQTTLHLDLSNTGSGIIAGQADIRFHPLVNGISQLPLDLLLPADSVVINGDLRTFTQQNEVLLVDLGAAFGPADTLQASVFYHGNPPTDPSGFGGFYTLPNYQYDLGVAFDAVPHSYGRSWLPCFDNFVERCPFEFFVRTTNDRTVVANGALIATQDLGGGEAISHWRLNESIPAYLASVAAGNYAMLHDAFPSVSGDTVPVLLAALPSDTADMRASFANLKPAFDTFERWFGPYRWNRVGYVLTSAGAMEHATNICYPDFAADGTLADEDLIAHELSHHWFGNLITCARPEEMYINEGFADFCASLFVEDLHGEDTYRTETRKNHHDVTATTHIRDGGWFALNAIPSDITYGSHSYAKGSDVARTLRGYLGDSLFSSGFKTVLAEHAFSAISSEQLRDALTAATGQDMSDFFNDWIFQPGGAAFMVDSFSVVPSGGAFDATVHIRQKTRGGAALFNNVPVSVTCVGISGDSARSIQNLGGASSVITVSCPFEPVAIRLNDDERLALATTVDDREIGSYAQITLVNSDITVTSSFTSSAFPLRVEEYWTPADGLAGYTVSPDRWWRIEGQLPVDEPHGLKFNVDGRDGLITAFDTGLMQPAGGTAFNEDSLVVLYRPNPATAWGVVPTTINTIGSATDKYARLDMPNLNLGDYAIAWRSQPVGIGAVPVKTEGWRYFPDPANGSVSVLAPPAFPAGAYKVVVLDIQGRELISLNASGKQTNVDVSKIPSQVAFLNVIPASGDTLTLGRLHIVH